MDLTRNKRKDNKEYVKKYLQGKPAARLYLSSRSSSIKRGIEHTLSVLDVEKVMVDTCPILGVKLTNISGEGKGSRHKYNPSIDRIDSSKGYVNGNIQVMSTLANKMKQDATKEELIAFAKGILKMYGEDCK